MGLKCGIVGLPNVGKSTIFNALTKAGIAAENYPFCTIEPNVGIVEVPDPRLQKVSLQERARVKVLAISSLPTFASVMPSHISFGVSTTTMSCMLPEK